MTDIVKIEKIYEEVVIGKRLGRHIQHDPASWKFPAETATRLIDIDHGGHNLPLDQGNIGSCTGNAGAAALECTPNDTGAVYDEKFVIRLYSDATHCDSYPGYYPPQDQGSSGLGVCRALKLRKEITSYAWCFSLTSALHALVFRPLIVGIPWFDSFDEPDNNATVHLSPDAQVRGGHELCVARLDVENQRIGLWQSWGPLWGDRGRFWMSWDVFGQCLANQGDVKVLIK